MSVHQIGSHELRLLSCKETAKALGLSVSTLERMRLDGSGPPFIKLGPGMRARVAYLRADLDAWVSSFRFQSTSEYSRDK